MEEQSGDVRREGGTAGEQAPDAAGEQPPYTPDTAGEQSPSSEPAAYFAPEFVSGSVPPAPEPYRPMRRRTLTLVVAAAAVLGVLAGAGAGYKVQHDRPPTPLPPLIAAAPTQPPGAGPDLPAPKLADDRNAVYEGNLLTLLLPTPKGAKQRDRGWLSVADMADLFDEPDHEFSELMENGFRRAVSAHWDSGPKNDSVYTEVTLTQFRDETTSYTAEVLSGTDYPDGVHQSYGTPIPGTMDGTVMPSGLPYEEGSLKVYVGQAFARVGDIFVEVYVSGLHPVSRKAVQSVITNQLERL